MHTPYRLADVSTRFAGGIADEDGLFWSTIAADFPGENGTWHKHR